MRHARSPAAKSRHTWIATVATALGLVACGPAERVVIMHPGRGDTARAVFDGVAFSQQITIPDNFVLRPDEFGTATADVGRGHIYIGSREGTLLALSQATGEVVWEMDLGGAISSRPTLVDSVGDEQVREGASLLVGTDNGELVAIDLRTREVAWRYQTDGRIRNEALAYGGVAYFANSRDQVFALDVRSGEWRWQYEQEFQADFTVAGRAGLTLVAADGRRGGGEVGTLYTGFDNGKVVALSAGAGEALWLQSVAPPEGGNFIDCDSTPLIEAQTGRVIVAGQATGVHALSPEDGSIVWRFEVAGARTIVAGPGRDLIGASSLEGVFALDSLGNRLWLTQVDPGVVSTPVVVGETVYVTHSTSGLLAFDATTGEFLAQVDPGSGMSGDPAFDPSSRLLFATSNRGFLVAMRLADPDTGQPDPKLDPKLDLVRH